MRKFGLILLFLGLGIIAWDAFAPVENKILSPLVEKFSQSDSQPERIYAQYSFEALSQKEYQGSKITQERQISKQDKYASWIFSYLSDNQKVTGQLNLPSKKGKLPVVIMLRGYAEKEGYYTGSGTKKAAGFFAENGFITLAPDFLGYGGSDLETPDILLNRFKRPITILNLIASLKNLDQANLDQVFIWAHSNGGQIALSILGIGEFNYPTALWAPVTTGFPNCILHYIDKDDLSPESEKVLQAVANFETTYDPKLYSTTNYYNKIQAPIQLHQGGADPWIPVEWQQELVKNLKSLGKEINYHYYPKADHNLKPNWDTAIERDLQFFKSNLE